MYIVYCINFQNVYTFTYWKTFCLLLKSSKAFSVSLKDCDLLMKFVIKGRSFDNLQSSIWNIFCWPFLSDRKWVLSILVYLKLTLVFFRFRVFCYKLCTHPYFVNSILLLICCSSVLLAVEDPLGKAKERNQVRIVCFSKDQYEHGTGVLCGKVMVLGLAFQLFFYLFLCSCTNNLGWFFTHDLMIKPLPKVSRGEVMSSFSCSRY